MKTEGDGAASAEDDVDVDAAGSTLQAAVPQPGPASSKREERTAARLDSDSEATAVEQERGGDADLQAPNREVSKLLSQLELERVAFKKKQRDLLEAHECVCGLVSSPSIT